MLLQDKVLVISGIGPGMGKELVIEAARQGAKLAIAARTASKLDDSEAELRGLGLDNEIIKVPTDISDNAQCLNLIAKTVEAFGRVDCLINSAYNPGSFGPIETADLQGWREALEVNLFGTMQLTQAAIPHLKVAGNGAIVMINSMVTRIPQAMQGGYATSKSALTSATANLALELGKYNIRVNTAYMGWMYGPPVESAIKMMAKAAGTDFETEKAKIESGIALGKIPDDADCAKAAIFLASDYACAITGASLDVNGGEFFPR